ncbi:MAG: hypothetical protein IKK40_06530 [Bacteroidales bacterium]|nr:hypothetical protein [Bacteroidales bacterium]
MKPIDFSQSTKVLQRPSTMAESECQSLPVWNDGKQCVSCWKATFKERLKILFTGKVWLGVLSGKTQPPVFVSGEEVFENPPLKARILAFVAEVKESIIDVWENVKEATKQPDKRKHFFVGLAISLVLGSLLGWWVGFTIGSLAGIVKEWWDSKGNGTVEVMDAVFTMLGALVGCPISLIIHNLIF